MPLLNHIETDSKKPRPLCRAVQQHFAPVGHRAAARMRGSIALGAQSSGVDHTVPSMAMGLFT
jgi:hypothetical protein